MTKTDFAVLLALGAAFASAIGNVVRQHSAQDVTDKPVGHFAFFRMSWSVGGWQLGAVAAIANYSLQAAALSLGSVILVTGLQVTALLFALPLYSRMTHQPVTRWEWVWAALLAAALAVVVTIGNPTAGHSRAAVGIWIVVALVLGPLLVLCVVAAGVWSGRPVASVLLAAVSGASLALFAVLIKGVIEAAKDGFGAVLSAPELYASVVAAFAGMMFQQSSYRGGTLTASMPTATVAKPTMGSLLGVTVLGEALHPSKEAAFFLVVAVVVMVIATAALARGEAASVEEAHAHDMEASEPPAISPKR